jgi:FixJ family two-component response regulator
VAAYLRKPVHDRALIEAITAAIAHPTAPTSDLP